MSAGVCTVCGGPTDEDHHLTGSTLDPELMTPHCHDHHELMHDDWNTAGVPAKNRTRADDDEDQPATFLHGLYMRLQRLALWLGRLDEAGLFRPLTQLLASAFARWATRLSRCIAALDAAVPGWSNLPGVAE